MLSGVRNSLQHRSSSYWESLINEENDEERLVKPLRQRKLTNKLSLCIYLTAVNILIISVIYCGFYGNFHRTFGYDNCGNVCGKDNDFSIQNQRICKAENMRQKPYLALTVENRQCVRNCSGENLLLLNYICIIKTNETKESNNVDEFTFDRSKLAIGIDLHNASSAILISLTVALLLSILWTLAFRISTKFIIWSVIVTSITVSTGYSIYLWIHLNHDKHNVKLALITSTLALLLTIFSCVTDIKVIVKLFKEAARVVIDVPMLLFQPIPVFVETLFVFGLWLFFDAVICTSGFAVEQNGIVHFEQNIIMNFTYWFNWFMLFWCLQFTFSFHEMILSGVTVFWFFTRNKRDAGYPYLKSVHMTIRFHLGTLSLGSLLFVVTYVFRKIVEKLRFLFAWECGWVCCGICWSPTNPVIRTLQCISSNAYTITALHGSNFFESGKHTVELLFKNVFKLAIVKLFGGLVLYISRLVVLIISVVVCYYLITKDEIEFQYSYWVPLICVAIFSYLIVFYFMGLYDIIIDALFVCYCEDCKVNDGVNRPYFMNSNMTEVIETSENILIKIKELYANRP